MGPNGPSGTGCERSGLDQTLFAVYVDLMADSWFSKLAIQLSRAHSRLSQLNQFFQTIFANNFASGIKKSYLQCEHLVVKENSH